MYLLGMGEFTGQIEGKTRYQSKDAKKSPKTQIGKGDKDRGWHSGVIVSNVASQQECPWFE